MSENGKIEENQALRNELIYSDKICLTILALLITSSCTIIGFVFDKDDRTDLLAVLPVIWMIGWFYISEKRFHIKRLACYIRTVLEDRESGHGWENWKKKNIKFLQKQYPSFDPYYLESALTLLVSVGSTIIFGVCSSSVPRNFGLWIAIIYFLFILIMCLSLWIYYKTVYPYDVENNKKGPDVGK